MRLSPVGIPVLPATRLAKREGGEDVRLRMPCWEYPSGCQWLCNGYLQVASLELVVVLMASSAIRRCSS